MESKLVLFDNTMFWSSVWRRRCSSVGHSSVGVKESREYQLYHSKRVEHLNANRIIRSYPNTICYPEHHQRTPTLTNTGTDAPKSTRVCEIRRMIVSKSYLDRVKICSDI